MLIFCSIEVAAVSHLGELFVKYSMKDIRREEGRRKKEKERENGFLKRRSGSLNLEVSSQQ